MTDIISQLTEREIKTVFECLFAAEQEKFFPEWEFETLFGIKRSQLKSVRENWPAVDLAQPDVGISIVCSMNHLLGYPDVRSELWDSYISVRPHAVQSTMNKLISLGL